METNQTYSKAMMEKDLAIVEAAAAKCINCSLRVGRKCPVFARGNPYSKVMVCGMVPGPDENEVGQPFVGRAGKLLDVILNKVNLDDVYITNVVKCALRPGVPLTQEWIDGCFAYVSAQIIIIQPNVIITLGADATNALLGLPLDTKIGQMRGRSHAYFDTLLVPTYHPSYLVRGGGEKHVHFGRVISDLQLALTILTQKTS